MVTLTLPTAVGVTGQEYKIKKIDSSSNVVTVVTTSSQTIDGQANVVISSQYTGLIVQSSGANWYIVGSLFGRNGSNGTF